MGGHRPRPFSARRCGHCEGRSGVWSLCPWKWHQVLPAQQPRLKAAGKNWIFLQKCQCQRRRWERSYARKLKNTEHYAEKETCHPGRSRICWQSRRRRARPEPHSRDPPAEVSPPGALEKHTEVLGDKRLRRAPLPLKQLRETDVGGRGVGRGAVSAGTCAGIRGALCTACRLPCKLKFFPSGRFLENGFVSRGPRWGDALPAGPPGQPSHVAWGSHHGQARRGQPAPGPARGRKAAGSSKGFPETQRLCGPCPH